jgi:TPR repeat protein
MSTFEQAEVAYEAEEYEAAFNILMPLAQSGEIRAQISIAGMYTLGLGVEQNYSEAVKWYLPAAEQGHPLAQNNLAGILFNSDLEEAIKWLFIAANNGVSIAQSMLGDVYSGAYNLPSDIQEQFRNDSEATRWYQRAGEGGFPYASHRLAEMYANGEGVTKNEGQAVYWYRKAAEDLYETSQEVLAEAYRQGLLGLPRDLKQAEYWLNKQYFGQFFGIGERR